MISVTRKNLFTNFLKNYPDKVNLRYIKNMNPSACFSVYFPHGGFTFIKEMRCFIYPIFFCFALLNLSF